MTNYQILVPLWGKSHAIIFANVVLPSLLQPGNIPFLANNAETVLNVICPSEDADIIRSSEFLGLANKVVKVRFLHQKPTDEDLYQHSNYARATAYYRQGMLQQDVVPTQTAFIFLTPDGIYGDASFKAVHARCEEGYKAVMIPGPRVTQESFLPQFHRLLKHQGSVSLTMSNRDLVHMFLENMHRISQSNFIDGDRPLYNRHPAHMYWEVKGEGIISRSFVNHPLMVKPDRHVFDFPTTIDQVLVPLSVMSMQQVYVCRDSDEIFAVDIAPYHYDQNTIVYSPHSLSEKIRKIHRWVNGGWATAFHLWQATQPSLIHDRDLNDSWGTIESGSQQFVARLLEDEGFTSDFVEKKERHIKMLDPWPLSKKYPDRISPPPRRLLDRIYQSLPMRAFRALMRKLKAN